jgi:hypothetical protein
MSSRRSANDPEPTGEIHLRQTVQMTVADQTRTFEISVTLPAGASAEEIDRTLQHAEVGMRGLSDQMDRYVSAAHDHDASLVEAAPHPPLLEEPSAASPAQDAASDATNGAVPSAPAPPPTPEPSAPEAMMTMQDFLAEAAELGYVSSTAAVKALGVKTLRGMDLAQALTQLRALHSSPATPPAAATPAASESVAPPPAAPAKKATLAPAHAFAEEIGPYDAVSDADDLAELDEPDFGAISDEHHTFDEGEAEPAPTPPASAPAQPTPEAALSPEEQRQAAVQQRLRQLRSLRGGGAEPTPELRQALKHVFLDYLGNQAAIAVINAVWQMAPGEKLNAPRTRALVEWGKEDDDLADTAARIITLAQQPAPVGEE